MAQSSPSASWASSLRDSTSQSPGAFRIPGPSTRFHKEHKQQQLQLQLQQEQERLLLQQQQQQQREQHQQQLQQQAESRPKYARFSTAVDTPAQRTRSRLSVSPSNSSTSPLPSVRPDNSRRRSIIPVATFMSHHSQHAPLTPVRSPHLSGVPPFGDSPYSDYFTDESRSVDDGAQYDTPTSESQKLLLRLNTLGAEILRQDPTGSSTITNLGAKLDDLEAALRTPSFRHNRRSSNLVDSGLGISDLDDDDHNITPTHTSGKQDSRPSTPQSATSSSTESLPVAIKTRLRNQDRLLKEAQDVLQRVSHANDGLRKRYEEIRQIHDSTVQELEEATQENLTLKSENESLKAALGFDHSELLFMKLQLKALEVEADAISDLVTARPELVKKRVLLNDDIDRWKADWDDVDARLHARRERHRIIASAPEDPSSPTQDNQDTKDGRDSQSTEDQGSWRLDMSKNRNGRVQSITIKRFNPNAEQDNQDDDVDIFVHELPMALMPKLPYCDQGIQPEDDLSASAVNEEKSASRKQAIQTIWEEEPLEPSGLTPPEQKPAYSEQFTQTDVPLMTRSEWDDTRRQGKARDEASQENFPETSTGENTDDEEHEEHEQVKQEPPIKNAWKELCDGLISFAGMDRD